jgi:hypothetical protein
MKKRRYLLIGFILYINGFYNLYGQLDTIIIKDAIKKTNIAIIKNTLDSSNINIPFNDGGGNALLHAILYQNAKVVSFLLKSNANPNTRYHTRTPLMLAVQKNNITIARILLKFRADINAIDSFGNTALMIAATNNKIGFARLLINHGASLNLRNKHGYSARDFAVRSNNRPMTSYLNGVFVKHLPNYFDGPYVFYKSNKKIRIAYLKHDSLRHRTDLLDSICKIKDIGLEFAGLFGDHLSYPIQKQFIKSKSTLTNRKKLLIIGDIHGQYDTLKLFLVKNKVIDNKLNWIFGDGTIVFIGDIFDRGEGVTEALWLIYKMENEATKTGGEVQLLLGNHELMIFQDDLRYVSEKYYYLFKNLKLNYSKYYNNKSLLGRWLKSKNTMLRIDSLLFVHGGIHSNILQYNVSVDTINLLIYNYINNIKKANYSNNLALQFLLSYNGPFWYRGMVEKSDGPAPSEDDLNRILNFYKVKHIFVGHTFFPDIKLFNDGKIVSTDIPFYLPDGSPMKALLIENGLIYLLDTSGERRSYKLY